MDRFTNNFRDIREFISEDNAYIADYTTMRPDSPTYLDDPALERITLRALEVVDRELNLFINHTPGIVTFLAWAIGAQVNSLAQNNQQIVPVNPASSKNLKDVPAWGPLKEVVTEIFSDGHGLYIDKNNCHWEITNGYGEFGRQFQGDFSSTKYWSTEVIIPWKKTEDTFELKFKKISTTDNEVVFAIELKKSQSDQLPGTGISA